MTKSFEDECHRDLVSVAEAVDICSPEQYWLLGELRDVPPNAPRDEGGAALPAALAADLYTRLYTRPAGREPSTFDAVREREHVAALSAANCAQGVWEHGWTVRSIERDGRIAATKDQVTFWVRPHRLRVEEGELRPDAACRVWVGKEMRGRLPGFYLALGGGNEGYRPGAPAPLLRIYWHLTAEVAAEYIMLATNGLSAIKIPFRTKVLTHPDRYLRADAGVLYLERRDFPQALGEIRNIYRAIRSGLRPCEPMFTKPLAPGLGLAEDPHDGMSFGQSRCMLAARSLFSAYVRGATDRDARLAALAAACRDAGIHPSHPFLAGGSTGAYAPLHPRGALRRSPGATLRSKRREGRTS
ncbi:T3SS effector HopA1 family protein [Sorangium sp. So ce426]|uniref:T3SS effector HopA1 family protein n=1 Tax=Sorangium sp. So ce426 TaxID=3133312 RepID=UPI003F5B7554